MRWFIQMQPELSIVQHERDRALLERFIPFFGCGSVSVNRSDATSTRYHYRVKSVAKLHNNVLPFYRAHPLLTCKRNDFELLERIVSLMHSGYHTQSLHNFLEVIDLGETLSERGQVSSARTRAKREKVNAVLAILRQELSENPEITDKTQLKQLTVLKAMTQKKVKSSDSTSATDEIAPDSSTELSE